MQGVSELIHRTGKDPLTLFEIDRMTITSHGISDDNINRVYRTLYVLTLGFYDTLHTVFGGAGEAKHTLMSRVWKVYETLLQYCCLTDFKTIAAKMVEDKA